MVQYLFGVHLGGLPSLCLSFAGQLVLQVSDLSLQQLDDLLVVLLGAAARPLPPLSLRRLQATLQTRVFLHSQTCFLQKKTEVSWVNDNNKYVSLL